ncbi:MAG TPA: DUF2062 domain-containing protein [Rariglobus sp.]
MPDSLPRRSFWQRRLRDPIIALLTHGVTPDKVAATFAVGTAVSLFPFIGFTTTFNIGVGLWFRMNQPLLQAINYLLTPLHLVMILVYVHLGEWIWGAREDRFSVGDIVETFRRDSLSQFVHRFGWAGVHAFTAWLVSVPVIIVVLYYSLRPLMRRLALIGAGNPS